MNILALYFGIFSIALGICLIVAIKGWKDALNGWGETIDDLEKSIEIWQEINDALIKQINEHKN